MNALLEMANTEIARLPESRQGLTNYGGHSTADEALAEVINRLVEALNPVAIYLFGSRARGTVRPDSDFDLMVVTGGRRGRL
jgi:hypothetical protein